MLTTIGHDAQRVVSLCASFHSPTRCQRHISAALLVVAMLTYCARPSVAATMYGNQVGATVTYVAVTESSATDPGPLFGTPTVSGDSLDFTPVSFAAASQQHVPAVDQTDGHLTFMVVPNNVGGSIQNIQFGEGGGLTVGGFGTSQTFVDVSAIGNIDVFEIDGVSINTEKIPIKLTFSHGNNAGFNDNGEWHLSPQGFVNGSWTGGQFIDIKQILIDRGHTVVGGATKISVALDNKLYAQSEIEGTASIDKKDFFTVTTNVPEPASCVLAMLSLVVGALASRRSR
jgi:hypothetical protein